MPAGPRTCTSCHSLSRLATTPKGTRTPVFWLRTRHPRPLDDGGGTAIVLIPPPRVKDTTGPGGGRHRRPPAASDQPPARTVLRGDFELGAAPAREQAE